MTDTQRAILSMIIAEPEVDTHRLAFADAIEEQSDPSECIQCEGSGKRVFADAAGDMDYESCGTCSGSGRVTHGYARLAEFIRVQCELAIKPTDQLRDREIELWGSWPDEHDARSQILATLPDGFAALPRTLSADLPTDQPSAVVHRGFVAAIRCKLDVWKRCGRKICREHPIQYVELTGKHPSMAGQRWTWFFQDHPRDTDELPMWLCPSDWACRDQYFESGQLAREFVSNRCIEVARSPRTQAAPKADAGSADRCED